MQRAVSRLSPTARRVRTLLGALGTVMAAAALYATNVQPPTGPAVSDYLAHATTVPAPSRAPAA